MTGPPKLPAKTLMGFRQQRGPTSTSDTLSAATFFLSSAGSTWRGIVSHVTSPAHEAGIQQFSTTKCSSLVCTYGNMD